MISVFWFRGVLLLVLCCYPPFSALLESELTGPKLDNLSTTQTLISFVQHSKLGSRENIQKNHTHSYNTSLVWGKALCVFLFFQSLGLWAKAWAVTLDMGNTGVNCYLSRCQGSDWLGEWNPNRSIHVQRHCTRSWETQKLAFICAVMVIFPFFSPL